MTPTGSEPSLAGAKLMPRIARRAFMEYRFLYTGIRVRDLDRSLAFYRGVLGMKEIGRGTMPHGGRYIHLRTPGSQQRMELNWYPEGSRFHAPYRVGEEMDHLAFRVANVRRAYEDLVRKGAEVAVGPKEARGVTEVYVKDPDGIWIELLG